MQHLPNKNYVTFKNQKSNDSKYAEVGFNKKIKIPNFRPSV
jgi:hypothetical protein